MPKTLKFDESARRGLETGVNKLADAVFSSLSLGRTTIRSSSGCRAMFSLASWQSGSGRRPGY